MNGRDRARPACSLHTTVREESSAARTALAHRPFPGLQRVAVKDTGPMSRMAQCIEGTFDQITWMLAGGQEVFTSPLKKRSCPARSELLHLESIKWIKFYQ
ncbi:hypothetical protein K0M31_000429 [Melipona bicolor]|uniref:Uncharacterized protein n=1 Tax=Melipona bicolor TaxID=60889 RepID=A0AA40KX20_9HYME|nr:hypothetical protein K0M31_000429 [Melipona bicolor]